jgi:CheY-like chemotaxis protein
MNIRAKPTVLIVEDEALIRMLAVEAFRDDDFTVLEAEHADAAIKIHLSGLPFQVLFTDVNMPGPINGIDLAEQLKMASPKLHVIVTSALPLLRPLDHMPATFVAKPYDLNVVCSAARLLMAA